MIYSKEHFSVIINSNCSPAVYEEIVFSIKIMCGKISISYHTIDKIITMKKKPVKEISCYEGMLVDSIYSEFKIERKNGIYYSVFQIEEIIGGDSNRVIELGITNYFNKSGGVDYYRQHYISKAFLKGVVKTYSDDNVLISFYNKHSNSIVSDRKFDKTEYFWHKPFLLTEYDASFDFSDGTINKNHMETEQITMAYRDVFFSKKIRNILDSYTCNPRRVEVNDIWILSGFYSAQIFRHPTVVSNRKTSISSWINDRINKADTLDDTFRFHNKRIAGFMHANNSMRIFNNELLAGNWSLLVDEKYDGLLMNDTLITRIELKKAYAYLLHINNQVCFLVSSIPQNSYDSCNRLTNDDLRRINSIIHDDSINFTFHANKKKLHNIYSQLDS